MRDAMALAHALKRVGPQTICLQPRKRLGFDHRAASCVRLKHGLFKQSSRLRTYVRQGHAIATIAPHHNRGAAERLAGHAIVYKNGLRGAHAGRKRIAAPEKQHQQSQDTIARTRKSAPVQVISRHRGGIRSLPDALSVARERTRPTSRRESHATGASEDRCAGV